MIINIPILYLCILVLVCYLIYVVKHIIIVLLILDLLILVLIILLIHQLLCTNFYGYALILLSLAAADTAVGLGLFVCFYKITGKTSLIGCLN